MSSSFQQQQPESTLGPRPCAAGCSFFGSPETLGMCSACYKMHCGTTVNGESAANSATASRSAAATATAGAAAAQRLSPPPASLSRLLRRLKPAGSLEHPWPCCLAAPEAAAAAKKMKKKAEPTRCAACYKKVGLLGFVCRCKKTFCGTHRHAEEHGCGFDFKGAGRAAIARNNPLVKGEKLAARI